MADRHTVPRMSEDDLKQFVLDYLRGMIFCSAQVPKYDLNLMGMIFMPMALGAFTLPEEEAAEGRPVKPEPAPKKPEKPEPPPEIAEPKQTPLIDVEADPRLQELIASNEFRQAPISQVNARRQELEERNAEIQAENERLMTEWRASTDPERKKYRAELRAWKKRVKRWQAKADAAAKAQAEYDEAMAKWQEKWGQIRVEYFRDIGLIYEYLDKAGPRSINGYPIFFSMRIMHRDDWARAARAIEREQKRMQEIEL